MEAATVRWAGAVQRSAVPHHIQISNEVLRKQEPAGDKEYFFGLITFVGVRLIQTNPLHLLRN